MKMLEFVRLRYLLYVMCGRQYRPRLSGAISQIMIPRWEALLRSLAKVPFPDQSELLSQLEPIGIVGEINAIVENSIYYRELEKLAMDGS